MGLFMEKRATILIADDLAVNREILSNFFEDKYSIIEAEDGAEAIAKLKEFRDEILIVLLDVRMPGVDGFGVVEYMKSNYLTDCIPIVMITSSEDYRIELDALAMGVDDFINKPFIPEVVVRRCENAIDFKRRYYDVLMHARDLEKSSLFDKLTGLCTMSSFIQSRSFS